MKVITFERQQGASWWQLFVIFVLVLLLFIAVRWQPEPWLRSQIAEQARQNGITLNYKQLQVEGFSVQLEQVSLHAANLAAPLMFNSLSIRPAWASLLGGSLAMQMQLSWQGQQGGALLSWQDDSINIYNIEAELNMTVLQSLWQRHMPLPVNVRGQIHISGDVRLDVQSGRPLEGRLDVGWQSAGVEMAGGNIHLGNYQLGMTAGDTSASWRWILGGGEAVLLQGKGTVDVPVDVQQAWPVSGQARIEAGKQAGMLSAMLGSTPLLFSLSGNAANPKLQRM
jgi:hypothetical protein